MSTWAKVEILVNFETFRNIDMQYQGLYSLQVSCALGGERAEPYSVESAYAVTSRRPPVILSKQGAIVSSFFLIKHSEEVVTLNETGVFRERMFVKPGFTDLPLELCVNLFFSDISAFSSENILEESLLSRVSTAKYKVNNALLGVSQFVPIVFPLPYTSVINSTVHCMVLSFSLNSAKSLSPYSVLLALTHNKLRRVLLQTMKTSGVSKRRLLIPPSFKPPLCPLSLSRSLYQLRLLLSITIRKYPGALLTVLERNYHDATRTRWLENVHSEQFSSHHCTLRGPAQHTQAANRVRKSVTFKFLPPFEVEDSSAALCPTQYPLLFEELYGTSLLGSWSADWFSSRNGPECRSGAHVFVLVHGLNGTSHDMRTVKDSLLLLRPDAVVFLSKSNEKGQSSINEMGERLATELLNYLAQSSLYKLSFIGYSLGGLVIRAALPHLTLYTEKFHLLLTMNSPHLGCAGNRFRALGLWLLTRLQDSVALKQLAEGPEAPGCYIHRLAQNSDLSLFTYVILISSSQDTMVPFESSRIESPLALSESLLQSLDRTVLIRVNLHYESLPWALSGRRAHMLLPQCRSALSLLLYRYSEALI